MIKKENIAIIGSAGRNCGKTEFVCELIKSLSAKHQVIGVKITTIREYGEKCPRGEQGCGVCSSLSGPYKITVETDKDSHKDTARMLRAGAESVYWLRVYSESLRTGINELLSSLPKNAVVVCESNSMRLAVDPGLFIIIKNSGDDVIKPSCQQVLPFADKIVGFDGNGWNFTPGRILFRNDQWILREKATAIILAGGKSLRMGADKRLLQVNGEPLICTISNQLLPYFDEVIIGANDIDKLKFLNLRIVTDIEKNMGPLMGILSCLKSSVSDLNFVTACDIPYMNIPFIMNLLTLSVDQDIVMPVSENNHFETLFAVYNKSIVPVAEEIVNNNKRRIIELFRKVRVKYVEMSNTGWYQNLNTKQNYQDFIQRNYLNMNNIPRQPFTRLTIHSLTNSPAQ